MIIITCVSHLHIYSSNRNENNKFILAFSNWGRRTFDGTIIQQRAKLLQKWWDRLGNLRKNHSLICVGFWHWGGILVKKNLTKLRESFQSLLYLGLRKDHMEAWSLCQNLCALVSDKMNEKCCYTFPHIRGWSRGFYPSCSEIKIVSIAFILFTHFYCVFSKSFFIYHVSDITNNK